MCCILSSMNIKMYSLSYIMNLGNRFFDLVVFLNFVKINDSYQHSITLDNFNLLKYVFKSIRFTQFCNTN